MNFKKTAITIAISTVISTQISASMASPAPIDFEGLFTLQNANTTILNSSQPYYYDTTWGYGARTQISGTLQIDPNTGAGIGTIYPFEFFSQGLASASNFEPQAIGNGLLLGNVDYNWNNHDMTVQIVLDASGLFDAYSREFSPWSFIDQSTCMSGLNCATPATNGIKKGTLPIGPVPIATTTFNTVGQNGYGTSINMLSLGVDDGIGGSPMDHGPFEGYSANFDITSISMGSISPIQAVPVPSAIWLFGSGLFALAGLSRRNRKIDD